MGKKIQLTERKRQSGATTKLCGKFYKDKKAILIVQNEDIKNMLIINNELARENKSRIFVYRKSVAFKELLKLYDKWYLDVCSHDITKKLMLLAYDNNKTLIGDYMDRVEQDQLEKKLGYK